MSAFLRSTSLAVVGTLALAAAPACGRLEAFNAGPLDDPVSTVDTAPLEVTDDDDDDGAGGGPGPGSGNGADTDTGVPCVAPDLWDLGAAPPAAGTFSPSWVGMWVQAMVEGGQLVDLRIDGVDASAIVVFTFYNAGYNPICEVAFDASASSTPSAGWDTSSGGAIYQAWDFALDANAGWTNCVNLGAGFGATDPRAWVAQRAWGFGYGELADLRDDLEADIGAAWATDWEPYAMGAYVKPELAAKAAEVGWVLAFEPTCYDVPSAYGTKLPEPGGPVEGALRSGDVLILNMSAL